MYSFDVSEDLPCLLRCKSPYKTLVHVTYIYNCSNTVPEENIPVACTSELLDADLVEV